LALAALNAVESDTISGERLKAKNQLRSLLEQADWLPATLGAMEDLDRRQLISRLQQSPAWSSVERHALLYRLTQACPDLQKFMVDAPPEAAAPTRRFTSLRSFRERQTQLHKLVTEEIPRNSRDIATARSYGDLSENFEYKSARETQGILLRRQQEFEAMLKAMTSTDFEGFPAVTASMGACVTLAHPDGRRERYAILGEWDNEERLGIISCKSKLAEALSGHQPGDQVEIPTESGPKTVTIAAVEALPPEIKAWINEAK
jgi:transcription elongation GreA/GreB family factor